jgi:hypothetical protein
MGCFGPCRRPLAFYSNRHGIFRVNAKDAGGGDCKTEFGRVVERLEIGLDQRVDTSSEGACGAGEPDLAGSPDQRDAITEHQLDGSGTGISSGISTVVAVEPRRREPGAPAVGADGG